MRKLKLFFSVLGCLLAFSGAAQQDQNCSQRLQNAQAAFDIGNLSGIVNMVLPCLNNGYSPEENIRAHKLITLVYLYQDDQENADKWMVDLLRTDPEHKLDSLVDPREIFFHYAEFKTTPIFRVRLSLGANATFVNSLTSYSIENTAEGDGGKYARTIGLNFFAEWEKQIYKGFEGGIGLAYATRGWTMERELEDSTTTLAGGETQTWIDLPVSLRYTHYSPGFVSPFVFAGASASYLVKSEANLAKNVQITLGENNDFVEQNIRQRLHYFIFAGVGAKFRFKTDFFIVDLRYLNGLSLVNSTDRYAGHPDIYIRTGYVDPNFGINNLMLNIGYQRSFYNPRKLKKR